MNLSLRDQIAEWLLEALARPGHEAPVRALAAFARSAGPDGVARDLSGAHSRALESEARLFEQAGDAVRLRADHVIDLDALRLRAERFDQALDRCRRTCGSPPAGLEPPSKKALSGEAAPAPAAAEIAWALCASETLFNLELFFEMHEILEPLWQRASGALRQFLQGLIQVAVGFHHHANGNLRGAVSLLGEGNAKLRPFLPEAWNVELAAFCHDVDRAAARLREEPAGEPPAPLAFPRLSVRRV